MQETWVRSLDWEDPLEKGKANHSSILAWRIPWASLIAQLVKNPPANEGDPSSIPELGRSAGEGIGYRLQYSWVSLVAQTVNNLSAVRETWVQFLVGKIPWRRAWQLSPVFLPGESPWTEKAGGL